MDSNPLTRFSDRAGAYAAARPDYPPGAVDAILEGLLPADRLLAADAGAGTGISSRMLADRGVDVIAIEPNEAMRNTAQPHPLITWRAGTGESTGLADASVDIVLCAQSFHWMDAAAALREFARILRPGARLALMWNVHDSSGELMRLYREIILAHAIDPPRSPWYTNEPCALFASDRFTRGRKVETRHTQTLDLAGLLARAESSSYLPRSGPRQASLHEQLGALYDRFAVAGGITLSYITEVFLAERGADAEPENR